MSKPELVVAPLTPFTGELKIDTAALKREIDYVVEDCGATMVVAAGRRGAGIHLPRPGRAQGPHPAARSSSSPGAAR